VGGLGRDEEEEDEDEDAQAPEAAMAAAVQADMAAMEQRGEQRDDAKAAMVVAAERGDRQAALMLMMDVSVPGVFPGLI